MARHQLNLLLLGILLVGFAVAGGVTAFASSTTSERDRAVERTLILASSAQAWGAKLSVFGGGSGSFANVDVWKVTRKQGEGSWYEEGATRYRITPLDGGARARVLAQNDALGFTVLVDFDLDGVLGVEVQHP